AASDTRTTSVVDVAKIVTNLGALPITATLVVVTSAWLVMRRRPVEVFALAGGFGLVVLAANVAKGVIDRPRPIDPLVHTLGSSYPSGHAAYSTVYVALAVVVARVLAGIVSRAALVLAGVVVAAVIGAT